MKKIALKLWDVLTSRTVLSGLFVVGTGIAQLYGVHADPMLQDSPVTTYGPAATITGGIGAIVFRIFADRKLIGGKFGLSGLRWNPLDLITIAKGFIKMDVQGLTADITPIGTELAKLAASAIKSKETDPAKLASIAKTATTVAVVFGGLAVILGALSANLTATSTTSSTGSA